METERDRAVEDRKPVAVPDTVKDTMNRVTPIPVPGGVWGSGFVVDPGEALDGAGGVA